MRFEKYGYTVEVDIETKKFKILNQYGEHVSGRRHMRSCCSQVLQHNH